jgi:hypothetical protein
MSAISSEVNHGMMKVLLDSQSVYKNRCVKIDLASSSAISDKDKEKVRIIKFPCTWSNNKTEYSRFFCIILNLIHHEIKIYKPHEYLLSLIFEFYPEWRLDIKNNQSKLGIDIHELSTTSFNSTYDGFLISLSTADRPLVKNALERYHVSQQKDMTAVVNYLLLCIIKKITTVNKGWMDKRIETFARMMGEKTKPLYTELMNIPEVSWNLLHSWFSQYIGLKSLIIRLTVKNVNTAVSGPSNLSEFRRIAEYSEMIHLRIIREVLSSLPLFLRSAMADMYPQEMLLYAEFSAGLGPDFPFAKYVLTSSAYSNIEKSKFINLYACCLGFAKEISPSLEHVELVNDRSADSIKSHKETGGKLFRALVTYNLDIAAKIFRTS